MSITEWCRHSAPPSRLWTDPARHRRRRHVVLERRLEVLDRTRIADARLQPEQCRADGSVRTEPRGRTDASQDLDRGLRMLDGLVPGIDPPCIGGRLQAQLGGANGLGRRAGRAHVHRGRRDHRASGRVLGEQGLRGSAMQALSAWCRNVGVDRVTRQLVRKGVAPLPRAARLHEEAGLHGLLHGVDDEILGLVDQLGKQRELDLATEHRRSAHDLLGELRQCLEPVPEDVPDAGRHLPRSVPVYPFSCFEVTNDFGGVERIATGGAPYLPDERCAGVIAGHIGHELSDVTFGERPQDEPVSHAATLQVVEQLQ